MEFKDFYELTSKAIEYKELLKENNQGKKQTLGTYYQEVQHDVAATEVEISEP